MLPGDVAYLFHVTILNRDAASIRSGKIHRGNWSRYIKGDAMLFRQNGDSVGPDFVGDIAIRRDAVRAHYNRPDLAITHHGARHIVGDHRGGNAIFHQLPRGQARALQKGPRFIGVDVDFLALFDSGADHAKSCAVPGRRQRACIAVRKYAAAGRHQGCSMTPHRLVRGDIFRVHPLRLFDQSLLDLRHGPNAQGFELLLHPPDGPEQVDGGGPGLAYGRADLIEVFLQIAHRFRFGILHP